MGLFGGLRKDVENHFLGYREVRLPNANVIELPNLALVKFLTSGDRAKASQYVSELIAMSDGLLVEAVRHGNSSPLPNDVVSNAIDVFQKDLNEEGKRHVDGIRPKIGEAMSVARALANLDTKRIAENPPVAQGIAIDAVSKISEKIVGESDWAILYVTQTIFYAARLGLKI